MSTIETAVAKAVAEELTTHIKSTTEVPLSILAHHFGVVCERCGYIPTEESAKRIFAEVWCEIARLRFQAEQLEAAVARLRCEAGQLESAAVKGRQAAERCFDSLTRKR